MPFIPHTENDIRDMLATIKVGKIEDLFDEIPASLRIGKLNGVPEGQTEQEISRLMMDRAEQDGVRAPAPDDRVVGKRHTRLVDGDTADQVGREGERVAGLARDGFEHLPSCVYNLWSDSVTGKKCDLGFHLWLPVLVLGSGAFQREPVLDAVDQRL